MKLDVNEKYHDIVDDLINNYEASEKVIKKIISRLPDIDIEDDKRFLKST